MKIDENLNSIPFIITVKNITNTQLKDVVLFNYDYEKQNSLEYSCGSPDVSYAEVLRFITGTGRSDKLTIVALKWLWKFPRSVFKSEYKEPPYWDLRLITKKITGLSVDMPLKIIHSNLRQEGDECLCDGLMDEEFSFWLYNIVNLKINFMFPNSEIQFWFYPAPPDIQLKPDSPTFEAESVEKHGRIKELINMFRIFRKS